jgi:putative hydrolase of the HAD superfamily
MKPIKAVGFDLFNTLIFAGPGAVGEALTLLTDTLRDSGFHLDPSHFQAVYREAAVRFIKEAHREGKETHNRFWISAALTELGHPLSPDDSRIAEAVEAYFSAFYNFCRLIPGTEEMLAGLKGNHRLGLLSNFTHPPAARGLMDYLGLTPFFDVVLISGDLGYRKPHGSVFEQLISDLGVERDQILFIGDDLDPDIRGAKEAGLHPVWMTYVRDNRVPTFPGYTAGGEEEAGADVPRISNWKDLQALLR